MLSRGSRKEAVLKIFLASPLGFAESSRAFISQIVRILQESGCTVFDPWFLAGPLAGELEKTDRIEDPDVRIQMLHSLSMQIARQNHEYLMKADGVLAVLDGCDVDSGTASEIGCAFAAGGKVINGYRGDFRRTGENDGCLVNLQVQYWIEASGGSIYTRLEDLRDCRWDGLKVSGEER